MKSFALFVWLISHQPVVLFSQNKPTTSNQPAVRLSQNKSAPAISHQPNEQADCVRLKNFQVDRAPPYFHRDDFAPRAKR
jgi:hypothetical protein